MLPSLLTTDLCSLKGNLDRYAFSVLWEVTRDADIVDVDFKKTIIHSVGALTYQQAQAMIDQPDDPNDVQACAVKGLASLARKLRKRRLEAGALTLASPEVKFVLDSESLNPTDVQAYTLYEANAVVEEFMLFANVTVSKKILRHYPTLSVLRRHPSPNRSMFDTLISKARCRGFDIDIEDSKRLADSLDGAVLESDLYFNKLLRILSTRCMSPAQYFCSGEYKPSDWHHYGLAAPVYTHFTSPIPTLRGCLCASFVGGSHWSCTVAGSLVFEILPSQSGSEYEPSASIGTAGREGQCAASHPAVFLWGWSKGRRRVCS